jgi:alginate O-acetyltransferase complex protein AlgI
VLFNGFTYLVFLPLVVILHWLLPKSYRKTLLLLASYIFYMHWMPKYGLLIFALTMINYGFGLAIAGTQLHKKKKVFLVAGIVLNLSCLCFFKYTGFIVASVFDSLKLVSPVLGVHTLDAATSPALKIILPLGISFFTFEFIHYITDVYRGSPPIRNIRDFALFAAFFPSQIAGPIKRFQDFVTQLKEESIFSAAYFQDGIFLILQGLFKKVALGDNLGALVNAGYAADAWITVSAFTLQLFFDFAGYTDIGRGSALLLGYKVPENFNWPYFAANLTEFWHRWHISLSTWLRDYLFIPLGGSRGSPWQTSRNTFLTMVLGGLWHGASWNFVFWGVLHGAGLVLSKDWHSYVSKVPYLARLRPHPLWHCAGVLSTVFFWLLTGVLFRAATLPEALTMGQNLFFNQTSRASLAFGQICTQFLESTIPAALLIYSIFCLGRYFTARLSDMQDMQDVQIANPFKSIIQWTGQSMPFKLASCVFVAVLILGFAPSQIIPFIYFQF